METVTVSIFGLAWYIIHWLFTYSLRTRFIMHGKWFIYVLFVCWGYAHVHKTKVCSSYATVPIVSLYFYISPADVGP